MIKLKFKQRIALGYYKTKFKTLGLINAEKAAEQAFLLFCSPYSGKPKRKEPPIFHRATHISVIVDELTIRGWHWKSNHPNAKKILVIHGFDSCSYKFEKYITQLKTRGFEVYAFDAPAHGTSDGKYFTALLYKKVLLRIMEEFGPFYGAMAHSVGGLALSLAAEEMKGFEKLVFIAPATETTRAVKNFLRFIPLTPEVEICFKTLLQRYAGNALEYFSVARAVKNIPSKIFWIHDEDDFICPIKDVLTVINSHQENIEFLITKQLGHNKIYRDENVFQKIISYFHND